VTTNAAWRTYKVVAIRVSNNNYRFGKRIDRLSHLLSHLLRIAVAIGDSARPTPLNALSGNCKSPFGGDQVPEARVDGRWYDSRRHQMLPELLFSSRLLSLAVLHVIPWCTLVLGRGLTRPLDRVERVSKDLDSNRRASRANNYRVGNNNIGENGSRFPSIQKDVRF